MTILFPSSSSEHFFPVGKITLKNTYSSFILSFPFISTNQSKNLVKCKQMSTMLLRDQTVKHDEKSSFRTSKHIHAARKDQEKRNVVEQ